ncbi:hydroxyacid dehydrogenase [Psychrobacillus sp. FJAT-51614]|uniref:Hydroxyacid dehydrogenase n=1 Tax=Psychrobacillus mangrovi TaxID=3117745 RepID=A0ABU8F434_9BACI
MEFKVLIPREIATEGIAYLEEHGCEVFAPTEMSASELKEAIPHYDAVLLRTDVMNKEVINIADRLKIIARYGVGLDNVDIEAATNRGIYVTYTPTANINSVSEHVIGLILSISRQIVKVDHALRNGDFNIRNNSNGTELKGKVLGIVGMGNIGKLVAHKCYHGFEMKVIAYDPYAQSPIEEYITMEDSLEELIKKADYISLHLPYNEYLHHIIDKEKIGLMKPTAFLINAARGGLIDEEALAVALRKKIISGAAIDVFEHEPAPSNHPLWEFDNVIVTPHIAALTNEAMSAMSLECAKEIVRIKNNKEPLTWVNKKQMTRVDD